MHPFSNLDAAESFSVCKILQLFHFEMYSLLFIAFWITPSEIMANLETVAMLQCHHLVTVKDLILQVVKALSLKEFYKTPLAIKAGCGTDVCTKLVLFIEGF